MPAERQQQVGKTLKGVDLSKSTQAACECILLLSFAGEFHCEGRAGWTLLLCVVRTYYSLYIAGKEGRFKLL